MRRLFKSKKALSPVVAAIILIAVTVAVSIAVATWMGALTFTFMKTEELKITGITWGSNYADLTMSNTGAQSLAITGAKVDNVAAASIWTNPTGAPPNNGTALPSAGYTLDKGGIVTVRIFTSASFTTDVKYNFVILTKSGGQYPYSDTKS